MSYSSLSGLGVSEQGFGHYSGLGFDMLRGAAKFGGSFGQGGSQSQSQPLVDVGVDPALVIAMRAHLDYMLKGSGLGADKKARVPLALSVGALKVLRPNSFGRYDPAKVQKALLALPVELRDFIDSGIARRATPTAGALAGYTVSRLLSDIAAGRFAGKPLAAGTSASTIRKVGSGRGVVVDAMKASADSAYEAVKAEAQRREAAEAEQARQQAAAEQQAKAANEIIKQAQPTEPSPKDLTLVMEQPPVVSDQFAQPSPDSLVIEPGPSEPVAIPAPPAAAKTEVFTKDGFLGVPWLYVAGISAGVLAVGYGGWRASRAPTPNKRRGRKRARRLSRRHSK